MAWGILGAIVLIIIPLLWWGFKTTPEEQRVATKKPKEEEEQNQKQIIDYSKLEELLGQGQWKEADYETHRIIMMLVNRLREDESEVTQITKRDLAGLPCEELVSVDHLWAQHSKGRFGFAIQSKIYKSLEQHPLTPQQKWNLFSLKVGWTTKEQRRALGPKPDPRDVIIPLWMEEQEEMRMFNLNAPYGHLPSVTYGALLPDFFLFPEEEGAIEVFFERYKTCSLPENLQQARHLLLKAQQLEEMGNLEAALINVDEAIKLDPKLVQAYYLRSGIRRGVHDWDGAIADIDRALQFHPRNAAAYNSRGSIHKILGDNRRAVTDFNTAIELDNTFPYAYFNRGMTLNVIGDKQQAMLDFRRAAQLYHQDGNMQLYEAANKYYQSLKKQLIN